MNRIRSRCHVSVMCDTLHASLGKHTPSFLLIYCLIDIMRLCCVHVWVGNTTMSEIANERNQVSFCLLIYIRRFLRLLFLPVTKPVSKNIRKITFMNITVITKTICEKMFGIKFAITIHLQ